MANFFGSITVLLDQPFQIGDWVVIGNVEEALERGRRAAREGARESLPEGGKPPAAG